jgi:hypothetical protein
VMAVSGRLKPSGNRAGQHFSSSAGQLFVLAEMLKSSSSVW